MIDLGAEWVMGEKGNPVYEMAWPLELLEHSDDTFYTFQMFTTDGKSLDIDKIRNLTDRIRTLYFEITAGQNSDETFEDIGKRE